MKKRSIARTRPLLVASILILSLATLLVRPQAAHAGVMTWWYVDCSAGSNGTGTSQSSPWNTLTSVNAHTFRAGDGLVFTQGTTCNGQLALQGSGASGNPIVIGAWNAGHGSANPILAGGGVSPATVYLHDTQYVTVEDLQVTNSGGSAGDRDGILAYNNPYPDGIWPVNSDSPTVRGNEVYGYVSQGKGDGDALDCDLHTTNCLMQDNYSHNNVDGFWMDCSGAGGRGEVLRYNISQDDATVKNGTFTNSCGGNPTPAVYNNTVYINSGTSPNIDGFPYAWGSGAFFTNNIIDNQGSGTYSGNVPWDHTLFYGSGNRPSNNTNAVVGNLNFSSPNGGGNGLSSAASAYALTSGSAALGAGVVVSGAPSKDYNNNNICGTPNIGAMDNLCGTGSSNRVSNPGFETGSLSPWTNLAGASVVSNNAHTGTYAVQTGNSNSGVSQTISGLASSHTYTLTGWVKSSSGSDAIYVGVKNYGGTETNNFTTSSTYTQISITFTTGSSNTSAQIYCWKNGGSAASFCDDFSVN